MRHLRVISLSFALVSLGLWALRHAFFPPQAWVVAGTAPIGGDGLPFGALIVEQRSGRTCLVFYSAPEKSTCGGVPTTTRQPANPFR